MAQFDRKFGSKYVRNLYSFRNDGNRSIERLDLVWSHKWFGDLPVERKNIGQYNYFYIKYGVFGFKCLTAFVFDTFCVCDGCVALAVKTIWYILHNYWRQYSPKGHKFRVIEICKETGFGEMQHFVNTSTAQ